MIGDGTARSTLILGVGNLLMGDEGAGIEVIRRLQQLPLPDNVTCLDGGTGSFLLLDPLHRADKVVLVDATVDGQSPGTVQKLRPQFSRDYPPTLTAHDIGLKDLIDTFYLLGKPAEVVLFAISISPLQDMEIGLTPALSRRIDHIVEMVLQEVRN
jgi:hydrogenase maturation protease